MTPVKAIPWVLAGLLVATIAWGQWSVQDARDEAMRERGRVVELQRIREIAEGEAAEARRIATAMGDSAELARQEGERRSAEAQRRAQAASVRAATAEARVRTTLDSLGASTASLDSLVGAHGEEIAAVREELAAVVVERDRLRTYAESMVAALGAADARTTAVEAERDAYRRQAEAWARAANQPWLTRAGKLAAAAAVGYVVGTMR